MAGHETRWESSSARGDDVDGMFQSLREELESLMPVSKPLAECSATRKLPQEPRGASSEKGR